MWQKIITGFNIYVNRCKCSCNRRNIGKLAIYGITKNIKKYRQIPVFFYDNIIVIWSCIWKVANTTHAIITDTNNIPTLFNVDDTDSILRTESCK